MRNLAELSVIMMGASGGIGSACALQIARPGIKIALCSIDGPALDALADRLREKGAIVFSRTVDVCSEKHIDDFINAAVEKFGDADVLINFAGLSVTASVEQLSEENYDRIMDVNVKGMFFGIKHFVKHVNDSKGALIINFGSMASKRANAGAPHYSAAKAAVNMFSQGLSEQLKKRNIRLTVMNPGPVNTTFYEGRLPPEKRTKFMEAADVAEVVEFVLSGDSRLVFHDIMFDSFEYFKG
jgi:3-oxoacyl-[acyl-carrier protein] reductase